MMTQNWARLVAPVIGLAVASFAQTSTRGPRLQMVVALAGENAVFASNEKAVSLFSSGTIRVKESEGDKWKVQRKDGDAFSILLDGPNWQTTSTAIDMGLASAPSLCDPLNQIDLRATNRRLGLALPAAAKIKVIQELIGGLAVVLYSTSSDRAQYVVRVALMRKDKSDRYTLIQDQVVTEHGAVCGLEQLNKSGGFLVEVDEPTASSDYLGLYFFGLAR